MRKSTTTDDALELYDRVDAKDRVVGSVGRAVAHSKHVFHRAVHVWLFDSRGRMFVQQRSATKDTNPLKWGSSMGGHLDRGESYEAAALRETREELGLKIGQEDLVFVRKFGPRAETNWEFVKLYFVAHDRKRHGRIRLNKLESAAGKFVRVGDIASGIRKRKDDYTPDFALFFARGDAEGVLPMKGGPGGVKRRSAFLKSRQRFKDPMSNTLRVIRMSGNFDWYLSADLEKEAGKWVVIVDRRVVASGSDLRAVMREVDLKFPGKETLLAKVPTKDTLIL
ncbi:MAG: NUDIX domain-containing protein [Candidatus Micrarchaeota archaeon]